MKIKVSYNDLYEQEYPKETLQRLVAITKDDLTLNERSSGASVYLEPWYEEGSERHKRLLGATSSLGIQLKQVGRDVEYEDSELRAAELLQFSYSISMKDDYLFGARKGTLEIKGKAIRGKGFEKPLDVDLEKLYDWEMEHSHINDLFISDRIKLLLEEAGIKGLHYWPCQDHKKRKALKEAYYGVSLEDVIEGCYIEYPEKDSTGLQPLARIRREALDAVRDIAVSSTKFGNAYFLFARPNVYDVLRDANIDGLEWWPVELIDNK